jgi:hypothetical protein
MHNQERGDSISHDHSIIYMGSVELPQDRPVLLYDNDCGICSRFARLAQKTSKGWVRPVGHFTIEGSKIKSDFFQAEDRPEEMFWILVKEVGYGGRSGLVPLLREVVRGRLIMS